MVKNAFLNVKCVQFNANTMALVQGMDGFGRFDVLLNQLHDLEALFT